MPTLDTVQNIRAFLLKSNLRRKMNLLHSVQRNVVLVIEKSRLCTHTKLLEYRGYIQRETLAMETYAKANYNLTLLHSRLQCSAFHLNYCTKWKGCGGEGLSYWLGSGHIYAKSKKGFLCQMRKEGVQETGMKGWELTLCLVIDISLSMGWALWATPCLVDFNPNS